MSVVIPLQALPNQELSVVLSGSVYDLTFTAVGTVMAYTLARDNVTLLSGARAVAGTPLLPYRYQEAGNFILITDDGAIPFYTAFGVTQTLLYYTAAELEAIRGGS